MAARDQLTRLLWGGGCAIGMAVVVTMISGSVAGSAALVCSGVAIAMQMLAARMMVRLGSGGSVDHVKRYAIGVFVRLVGIVILAVLVSLDRSKFPPLASAAGYLGTVLPLLYVETRLSR